MTPTFDSPALAREVESLTDAERHSLPYGVIKLDPSGTVCFYSETEARNSGRKKRPTVGLAFFTDVAPCMNTPQMRGRIEAAQRGGIVDVEIGWVGDFDDDDGEITIRAVSASDGGLWLFMQRD